MNTIYLILIILTVLPSHPSYDEWMKNGQIPYEVLRPIFVPTEANCVEVQEEIKAQLNEHIVMNFECRPLSYSVQKTIKF